MSKQKAKSKRSKKNNRANGFYTPNYNAFGERAETHLVMVNNETALEQLVGCFVKVLETNGKNNIEFTIGWENFDGDCAKQEELCGKAMAIASMIVSNNRRANNGGWVA